MTARDPVLIEVIAALGAGRVVFRPIHADGEYGVHGCCEPSGVISINPAIEICSTAIHEALHRLRPGWSERRVRAWENKLVRSLSDKEIDRLYAVILSVAQVSRRPLRLEVDE